MKIHLSKRRIILDGLILSSAFMFVAFMGLYIDARLWIQDYPPEIQAVVGESFVAPVYGSVIFGLIFIGIVFGGLLISNHLLKKELGNRFSFSTSFVHTFILFWIINAADVFILDWLIFVTIQPDFVILPGTEGMAEYKDYYFHFKGSFLSWTPWLGAIIISGIIAGISNIKKRPIKKSEKKFIKESYPC